MNLAEMVTYLGKMERVIRYQYRLSEAAWDDIYAQTVVRLLGKDVSPSYSFVALRNAAIDWRKTPANRLEVPCGLDAPLKEWSDGGIEEVEARIQMELCLSELSEKQKAVVVLRYLGYEYGEIDEMMGWNENCSKNLNWNRINRQDKVRTNKEAI